MRMRLVMTAVALMALAAMAMPPKPGVREQMTAAGQWERFVNLRNSALEAAGMAAAAPRRLDDLRRPGRDQVVIRAVCVLVDFDDHQADTDPEHYRQMLFSRGEYRSGSMRDYYLENSYGEFDVQGEVFGWYRMRNEYAYYVDGQYGFGDYPRNAQGLVVEGLRAADADADFSEFDNDGDHLVEALFVVHAGPGAEATGSVDDIWSHASVVPGIELDGVRFDRYAMEPENGTVGVFGHELGHSLFGLPDLYDYTGESAGIGFWSMMAAGSWGGGDGSRPVHFDAWCKTQMGFAQFFPIIQNMEGLELLPAEQAGDFLLAWRHGDWRLQYFLLENRRRIGFDQSLPGEGLLIWHIDEEMPNNDHAWWPERGGQHNKVALEQADGQWDLEHNRNGGDRGDPYPGSAENTKFDAWSVPDSRDYGLRETDVAVYNIEPAPQGNSMFLSVGVFPGAGADELHLLVFNRIPPEHTYPHPDIRPEEVPTREIDLVTGLLNQIGAAPEAVVTELPEDLSPYNVVMYLESWREGDEPEGGMSGEDRLRLADFLDAGNNLLLIGPDIATNLQVEDDPLWPYLAAEYIGPGRPSGEGNIVRVIANEESRMVGQNFPFRQGPCDHYPDVVGAGNGAQALFRDQAGNPRGLMVRRGNGARLILQPFLFGGLIDFGGGKTRLLTLYFQQLQFYLTRAPNNPVSMPRQSRLLSAWPNPFNETVTIAGTGLWEVTRLLIVDAQGRPVYQIPVGSRASAVQWNAAGLPAGPYWVVSQTAGRVQALPVVLLR